MRQKTKKVTTFTNKIQAVESKQKRKDIKREYEKQIASQSTPNVATVTLPDEPDTVLPTMPSVPYPHCCVDCALRDEELYHCRYLTNTEDFCPYYTSHYYYGSWLSSSPMPDKDIIEQFEIWSVDNFVKLIEEACKKAIAVSKIEDDEGDHIFYCQTSGFEGIMTAYVVYGRTVQNRFFDSTELGVKEVIRLKLEKFAEKMKENKYYDYNPEFTVTVKEGKTRYVRHLGRRAHLVQVFIQNTIKNDLLNDTVAEKSREQLQKNLMG